MSSDGAAALAALPNLGPRSAALLAGAGIASPAALRRLGAVAAFARVRAAGGGASLNLLWALEGALTGLPWQVVAREHRTSLLLALEEHERAVKARPTRRTLHYHRRSDTPGRS